MPGGKRAAKPLPGCKQRATGESALDVGAIGLRPAHHGDLAGLIALDRLCFGRRAWTARGWSEVVADPAWTALVASIEGVVVAAVVLLLDRPLSSLASIAVHPALRRHGLGRALLRDAVARARASGSLFVALEVDRSNRLAVRLYRDERFGVVRRFREEGRWRLEMLRRLGRCRRASGRRVPRRPRVRQAPRLDAARSAGG